MDEIDYNKLWQKAFSVYSPVLQEYGDLNIENWKNDQKIKCAKLLQQKRKNKLKELK